MPAANNPQWAAVGLQDGAALLARVTDDGLPVVREIDPIPTSEELERSPHAVARPRRHRARRTANDNLLTNEHDVAVTVR